MEKSRDENCEREKPAEKEQKEKREKSEWKYKRVFYFLRILVGESGFKVGFRETEEKTGSIGYRDILCNVIASPESHICEYVILMHHISCEKIETVSILYQYSCLGMR